ncbi:quinoprotein dehydrogenase-associated SoxYZ-like carrier [Salinisphaera aquimarina]|uniref:Quinoprotein dehydrogenase-associated SoxYZ-like carrier n=1 Tax=Salinisphaera aquimarina TaxID=2094031 RepID=A0ABV7EN77_9GAMM
MKRLMVVCLTLAVLAPTAGTAAVPDDPLQSSQWIYMARKFFRDAPVVFDDRVKVQAPDYAENSLDTPVQVSAPGLDDVEQVLVFADLSPITRVLDYYPVKAEPSIGFAFKIQQATPIRAAMRTSDGTWHVGGKWIDAQGGGCTAPSVASASPIWETRLGETTARLWSPDREDKHASERLKVRVIHPMDTGLAAGIPAFYISEMTIADADGQTLARITPYEPVSENPVFTLDLDADGPVTLSGHDNNGNRFNSRVDGPES